MASFFAMYPEPDDVEGFEEHYRDTHIPLVEATPGVQEIRQTRSTGAPGGDPDFYLVVEVVFGSEDELNTALRSDEFNAAGADLQAIGKRFGIRPVALWGS